MNVYNHICFPVTIDGGIYSSIELGCGLSLTDSTSTACESHIELCIPISGTMPSKKYDCIHSFTFGDCFELAEGFHCIDPEPLTPISSGIKIDIAGPTGFIFLRGHYPYPIGPGSGIFDDCDPAGFTLTETWVPFGVNQCGLVFSVPCAAIV